MIVFTVTPFCGRIMREHTYRRKLREIVTFVFG